MKLIYPVLAAVLSLASFCPAGWAETADKTEEQFMALGMARTKVELAFRKCNAFFQNQQETYYSKGGRIDELHGKIVARIQANIQSEKAKIGDDYNQANIDAMNAKQGEVEQQYQVFQRERQALDGRFRECEQRFRSVEQVFNALQNIERPWKDAQMDTTSLTNVHNQLARAVGEVQERTNGVIKDAQEKVNAWEATLKEVSTPPPAAAKPAAAAEKPAGEGQK